MDNCQFLWPPPLVRKFVNEAVIDSVLQAALEQFEDQATNQWRSQNIADARAQHGHTTFKRISAPSAQVSGECSSNITTSKNGSEAIS